MNIHTITNSIFHSKTYILTEEKKNETWLIDCGDAQPCNYITTNSRALKNWLDLEFYDFFQFFRKMR